MNLNKQIAEILGIDNLTDDEEIKKLPNYDSLNMLTVISFIKKEYDITLTAGDINKINTINDLRKIMQEKEDIQSLEYFKFKNFWR